MFTRGALTNRVAITLLLALMALSLVQCADGTYDFEDFSNSELASEYSDLDLDSTDEDAYADSELDLDSIADSSDDTTNDRYELLDNVDQDYNLDEDDACGLFGLFCSSKSKSKARSRRQQSPVSHKSSPPAAGKVARQHKHQVGSHAVAGGSKAPASKPHVPHSTARHHHSAPNTRSHHATPSSTRSPHATPSSTRSPHATPASTRSPHATPASTRSPAARQVRRDHGATAKSHHHRHGSRHHPHQRSHHRTHERSHDRPRNRRLHRQKHQNN